MIIPNNGSIKLDYDPATDILCVALPDFQDFTLNEVEQALQAVAEAVNIYYIKKLLLDSSQAVVAVDDEAYRSVIMKFSRALMKTRLRKLARVGSSVTTQELRAFKIAEEIQQVQTIPLVYQNFTSKDEATVWLSKQY